MTRIPRNLSDRAAYPIFFGWCEVSGTFGGTLFVAWGYVEDFGAVTHVLPFVVTTLFLATIVGLCVLWKRQLGVLRWIGMTLTAYGLGWGMVSGIFWSGAVWAYVEQRGRPHYLSD